MTGDCCRTAYLRPGDEVFPTIMDEGLAIETILPVMSIGDEWAFYRRIYRIEKYGRSWRRGTS